MISAEDSRPAAALRPLTPSDLADVLALERELFPEDPWSPEMFEDELDQPRDSRLYLLAEAPAEGDQGRPAMAGRTSVATSACSRMAAMS